MKLLVFSFWSLLFCASAFSQDKLDKEKLAADFYEKGLELRHSQKDSSYHYLDLATKYSIDLGNYTQALDIIIESIFGSGIHYDLKKYGSYLKRMETLLQNDSVLTTLENPELYQNTLTYEQGSYLTELRDYEGAKIKFRKLYGVFSKKEIAALEYNDLAFLIYSTNLLASIYNDLGKYELAENYFNRSLQVVEGNELAKVEGFDRATNRLLAQLYIDKGMHTKADIILNELLVSYKILYKEDKEYKNNVVVVYQRLVNNLLQQDSLNKALNYLKDSQHYLIEDDPFYKESLLLYGDIYLKQRQNTKALKSYQNALHFFKEYRQGESHQDIAEVYGRIARFHLEDGNYSDGLEVLQNALKVSGKTIKVEDYHENPKPSMVYSKRQLLRLLDLKLQLLQIAHEKTKNNGYLQAALQTNRDILSTFDLLKKEFESKLDKQFLVETAYPIFHRMLGITFEAYRQNRSPHLFELALNISEKNKDLLLLETLRNTNATQYGRVSKNIVEKEARLRAEISNLEKKQFKATGKTSDFSEDLFNLKQDYYNFLDTIKSKYPKYHNLKYQSYALNLGMIRDDLEDNEVMISFSMANEYLYVLVVNDDSEDFLKLPFNDADKKSVREFYKLISKPVMKDNDQVISKMAVNLYNKILKPPLANFEEANLTIIPDDVLHYLPFDLLEENHEPLLRSKIIGYGNSISSYLELKGKRKSNVEHLIAFAPNFDNQVVVSEIRFEFGKLLYNDDEVKKIGDVFETELYVANEATLKNFREKAPEFSLIHLATHASANDEFPDFSYLAFTKEADSSTSNVFYIKDLYNTSLSADMVVLSACQTGIGKLQKGQGMMSLSKGFYYAGAKSLVSSLWKVNDKSTVKLMEYFYKGLSEGKSKAEALRFAKLKYLETTDDNILRQPYYWAAFVVSGNVDPIKSPMSSWWWCALMLIPAAMGTYYLKSKISA